MGKNLREHFPNFIGPAFVRHDNGFQQNPFHLLLPFVWFSSEFSSVEAKRIA
jgi:hypothetical protein